MKNTPPGFDKWNRALQGAFRKGYTAYHDGWKDGWFWAQRGN